MVLFTRFLILLLSLEVGVISSMSSEAFAPIIYPVKHHNNEVVISPSFLPNSLGLFEIFEIKDQNEFNEEEKEDCSNNFQFSFFQSQNDCFTNPLKSKLFLSFNTYFSNTNHLFILFHCWKLHL